MARAAGARHGQSCTSPLSQSRTDLILQGVRCGLGGISLFEGGGPFSPSGRTVLVNSGVGQPANVSLEVAGYASGNTTLSSGSRDAQGGGPKASGDAARLAGQEREEQVANIVNGSTSGEKVAVPGIGSTDIDVVARNGDLIAVGGPAKANNLGKLAQELRIYQAIANQRGVSAQVYFAEGTPRSAINLATKILGEGNVKIFSGSE